MSARARRVAAATVLAALVATGPLAAQNDEPDPSATEGALFLLLPVGARAVALGRAVTALPGAEGAFWNPAGLASVQRDELMLVRGDHAVGTATALTFLAARPGLGTLGISYFLLDAGELERRDEFGQFTGTITIRNHLGVLSAATRLLGALDAGVNLKLVQFRLSCRGQCPDAGTTATTWAVDAGVQVRPVRDLPLRFGLMLAHVGRRLQVVNAEQADPLPARARAAAAFDIVSLLHTELDLQGWLTLEVQDRLRDPGSPSLYVGSEFQAGDDDALMLRAGYVVGDLDQEDGARVGVGLRYERFELGIAKSLAISTLTGETEPVHVTLQVLF